MADFLILSEGADGVGLAARLKAEGHDVAIWIRDSAVETAGDGIVEKTTEYRDGQIVIADCTGLGTIMDAFRSAGIPTFGGSSFADKLEADRGFAEEVLQAASIKTPRGTSLRSWDDVAKAINRLARQGQKIVLKPEGSLSGVVPSYVAADGEDALRTVERFKRAYHGEPELTVQEHIEGVAVSTEGWFNGEDWVPGLFNHTLERKHLMNGDVGPSGGCTGNVVWACGSDDPIVKQVLTKLTDVLREHRYVGPIDVNCIVNDEGIYALEFTPRFGYDAFPTLLRGLAYFDFGDFVEACSRSEVPDVSLAEGFAAGIRLTLPPWPSEKYHAEEGVPIRGFDEDTIENFYPYGVRIGETGEYESAGAYGILGVVNARGDTIGEAFSKAYLVCRGLKISNVQYRTDLKEVLLDDYRELRDILSGSESGGWIAVDLDGTLAEYHGWSEEIGEPIPKMVNRVRRFLENGKEVRILTARGTLADGADAQLVQIYDWIKQHIGWPLEVTDRKDPMMIRLYDDRVVQVQTNTGEIVRQ